MYILYTFCGHCVNIAPVCDLFYLVVNPITYYMMRKTAQYVRKPFNISKAIETDIAPVIEKLIDRTNAVYSDDIQKEMPQYTKNAISFWLRTNGFVKPMGQNSKRWVRKDK